MKTSLRILIFLVYAVPVIQATAQSESCANPNAPRIGILAQTEGSFAHAGKSPELLAFVNRFVDAEDKLRVRLENLLPADVCIVRNREVFDDPKNYPQLKGSTVVEIQAVASRKNPEVFALAVTVSRTLGVNVTDEFRMFTIPVLIESESDYASGAEDVMRYWRSWSAAEASDQKK